MEARDHVKESERLNASVMFSLGILDFLETKGSASLTELSAEIKINKSRVLRLCGTMEQMGYLRRRREDARYVLGARLLSLGKAFERQNQLIQILRPEIEKISREIDENVLFMVLRSERRLCVCAVSCQTAARYITPEGGEAKLFYGASGKVFLAWGPPELRAQILAAAPYPQYTPHTRTTAEALLRDIDETLAQGYAVSREERTYGTAALAMPVFGAEGALLGSISVPTTTDRMTREFIDRAVPILKSSAAYIQSMTAGAEKFVPPVLRRD